MDWTVTKHTSFISVSYQQFIELKYVGVFGYISLCYNTTYDIDISLEGVEIFIMKPFTSINRNMFPCIKYKATPNTNNDTV